VKHIVLVAKNAFRGVMSQRALYMWGFAVVIMFLRSAPALFSQNRAPDWWDIRLQSSILRKGRSSPRN